MQEVYPTNTTPKRYKICLMFEMRYAGPFASVLWILLNGYICVISFLKMSFIYSYLDSNALIAQGVVCFLFVVSAVFSLHGFYKNFPRQLKRSHRLIWTSVILFLTCYFANMILFFIQKPQFDQWCINKSRRDTSNYIFSTSPNNSTLLPDSQIYFSSRRNGASLYNCTRLWEDEAKLAVVLFFIFLIVYIHFAMCFWRYTQVRMRELEAIAYEIAKNINNNINMMSNNTNMMSNNTNMMSNNTNMMSNNTNMMNNNNMMMNLAPNKEADQTMVNDDQKSLAQLARAVFGRLR
ncbi:hypothetical protein BD408DRAFT_418340 [Parasitella parasitica]|nr:hypothetical protein BD408DRAFT_418340 [Parasitella parasitica]